MRAMLDALTDPVPLSNVQRPAFVTAVGWPKPADKPAANEKGKSAQPLTLKQLIDQTLTRHLRREPDPDDEDAA